MSDAVGMEQSLVFGLDIGTRSIVGTVGYQEGKQFHIVAQAVRFHDTRAMLDGQIHDIGKVARTISAVKADITELLPFNSSSKLVNAANQDFPSPV